MITHKVFFLSFFLLLFVGPEQAYSSSYLPSFLQPKFKEKNTEIKTEATVPAPCTTGMCHGNPHINDPLEGLPEDNIARGVPRVLATLYGACDAAKPLNAIRMDAISRNKVYNTYRATDNQQQAQKAGWKVYIPGFTAKKREVREITDSEQFDRAGPYAAAKRGKMCTSGPGFDVASKPKAFGLGASGVMNSKGEYDILRCGRPSFFNSLSAKQKAYTCGLAPNSKPVVSLDCAEFIGAVAVASCKKLHKSQKISGKGFEFPVNGGGRELSTASMVDSARVGGSSSCLTNDAQVSPESTIMPGDIFAGSSAHSIMITKVGVDPLGIGAAKNRRGGCDSISYDDFDFDMAHSPSHSSLGPINSSARAYAKLIDDAELRHPYPLNKILQMAKVVCKRQTVGPAQSFMSDSKFSLIRHKSSDPACSYSGKSGDKCPKLSGDDCADECGV